MTPGESPQDCFPYVCTEETDLPRHLRVRAEGLPLREAIWSGVGYLRKYHRAKWTAPPEEIRYFDAQRQLIRRLAADSPGDVRLAAVGDIMWLRDHWDSFLSPDVLAYLNGYDAVVGNLESPIARSMSVPGLLPDYFTYNSDPRLISSFRRPSGASTFSALGTANNHSLDRGDSGLAETLAFLDESRIAHSGVRRHRDDRPWVTFEARGIRIGFLAACWGLNNPDAIRASAFHIEVLPGLVPTVQLPLDLSRIQHNLDEMQRDGVEFRIVALHWGHEFEFYPCPRLMQVAREIVRAGADLVLGTHPHVVQPFEVCLVNGYEDQLRTRGIDLPALAPHTGCLLRDSLGVPRKALIAYSLGNFASAMFTLHCRTGLILGLSLRRDPTTGRIDWHQPETQLVYNVARDPATGHRRLVLLDRFLRDCQRRGDPARDLRQFAARLDHHLHGSP